MKTSPKKKPIRSIKKIPQAYFDGIVIESVAPEIDAGAFAAKTTAGNVFLVTADIYKEGREILGAALKVAEKSARGQWQSYPMHALENDRWQGAFSPEQNTRYLYTVEAWVDVLATWLTDTEKMCQTGDVKSDVLLGISLLERLRLESRAPAKESRAWMERLQKISGDAAQVMSILRHPEFLRFLRRYPLRDCCTVYHRNLELIADRERATYGAWYELFPRSQSPDLSRSGNFKDCVDRLPDIKKMGFHVVYLPPIHPIGLTNRKGPNNTLDAAADATGCPWAIGGVDGGHKAIHADLGSKADFQKLIREANSLNIEIALDFAAQCSPDHPYVKDHPDWFFRLPDGTIRCAENPPKKYEDIYPINFRCKDKEALWNELKNVLEHWIEMGVKIFRVDNPHTKPFRFWQWLIKEIQEQHPEVLFLSEAFTRPKVMKYLAKAGFTQSYTYFTWRNQKWELMEYFNELFRTEMRHYFRPNLFVNTPDILHEFLQDGGRPAFIIRFILAATISPVYGIYSGYELCENTPLHKGSEEYLDSEKYQQRARDWDEPGNIKDLIARLNFIRTDHPALQQQENFSFLETSNEYILAYAKWSHDNSDLIVVVLNLDPFSAHEDTLLFPIADFGIQDWQTFQMKDLLTGEKYDWKGTHHYVRLDPRVSAAHVFHVRT